MMLTAMMLIIVSVISVGIIMLYVSCIVNWLQTVSVIIARVFLPSPTAGPVGNQSVDFSATGCSFRFVGCYCVLLHLAHQKSLCHLPTLEELEEENCEVWLF